MSDIPYGFCRCGCGRKTNLAPKTNKRCGWIKDEPLKFINHHQHKGAYNPRWNGGTYLLNTGYLMIKCPNHPRSGTRGYVMEHILIAEKILGKYLPPGAEIHHADGNRTNNQNNNLVICQDHAYHMLLNQRLRAYLSCGNPHWRKCAYCKKYDDPVNMSKHQNYYYHNICENLYRRKRKLLKTT